MAKYIILAGLASSNKGTVSCGVAQLVDDSSAIETVLFKTKSHSNYFCALISILEILKKHPEALNNLEIYQQNALGFAHPEKSPNYNLLTEINSLAPNLLATVVTGACQSLVQEVRPTFDRIPFDTPYTLKDKTPTMSRRSTGDGISKGETIYPTSAPPTPAVKQKSSEPNRIPLVEECVPSDRDTDLHRMTADGWKARKMWINDRRLQVIITTFENFDEERKDMALAYIRSIRRPEDGNINKP